MPHYIPLPKGTIVRDDRGTEWCLGERGPDDDGTPTYWARRTDGKKDKSSNKAYGGQSLILSCFIDRVLRV